MKPKRIADTTGDTKTEYQEECCPTITALPIFKL